MSARREFCRRKEITLSQQKVEESPRMEESRREGCIVGRKGKEQERAEANLGCVGRSVECRSWDTSVEARETYSARESTECVPNGVERMEILGSRKRNSKTRNQSCVEGKSQHYSFVLSRAKRIINLIDVLIIKGKHVF